MSLFVLSACPATGEITWVQFNGSDDTLEVNVTASTDLGDVRVINLTSTTGANEVGTAQVDPGSGPVGTDHELLVTVDDAYQEVVGRVTVVADAGDRGNAEHELIQDSADHGYWVLSLTSLGAEAEERVDTFTVVLWRNEEDFVVVEDTDATE